MRQRPLPAVLVELTTGSSTNESIYNAASHVAPMILVVLRVSLIAALVGCESLHRDFLDDSAKTIVCAPAEYECEVFGNQSCDQPAGFDPWGCPDAWVEACYQKFSDPPWQVSLLDRPNGTVTSGLLVPKGGTVVDLLETQSNWIRVRAPGGKVGWIQQDEPCAFVTSQTTPHNKPMQTDDSWSRPSHAAPTSTLRASPST